MNHVLPIVFTGSMASGASLSEAVDLGGTYQYVTLDIPTHCFGADTAIFVRAAHSAAASFRRIGRVVENTATVAFNDFVIVSAASQRMVQVPLMGNQLIKLETTATVTSPTFIFRVICTG